MLSHQYNRADTQRRWSTWLASVLLVLALVLSVTAPVLAAPASADAQGSALQQALLKPLAKKGFMQTPHGDAILLSPYTRGVESVTEFALYRPKDKDSIVSNEHIYVVESKSVADQEFVLDGFQQLMATAKSFGAEQKDAAILRIDDTVIYYQLKSDRALKKALRSYFDLSAKELEAHIVSDYGKNDEAIAPLVEEDYVLDIQVATPSSAGGRNARRVENEQKEFLFAEYNDLWGGSWFGTRLFSFIYKYEPVQMVLCIDPFHLSEKTDMGVLQGEVTMPLEEFALFEGSDPALAHNVQRYSLAGMTLLHANNHILSTHANGLTLTPEGYRIYAAMSKLILEQVMQTKIYQDEMGDYLDLSKTTLYSLPEGEKEAWGYDDFAEKDVAQYRLDLTEEISLIEAFLADLDRVPEDVTVTNEGAIKKGDVFTYETGLKATLVELFEGDEHPFAVEILDGQIVLTATEDLPIGEGYAFTFIKKTGVAEDQLLFSNGTAAGRPSTNENNQGIILVGADRSALPPFRFNVYSKEKEADPVGGVTLTKVAEGDEGNLLAGAEFELYAVTEEATQELTPVLNAEEENRYVTDAEGNLTVENLPLGNYLFREVKAPAGYLLNEEGENEYLFEINENHLVIFQVVRVTNVAEPEEEPEPEPEPKPEPEPEPPVSSAPASEAVSSAPVSEAVSSAPASEAISSAPASEAVSSAPVSEARVYPMVSEPTPSVVVSQTTNSVVESENRTMGIYSEATLSSDEAMSVASASEDDTISKRIKGAYSEDSASSEESNSSKRSGISPKTGDSNSPLLLFGLVLLTLLSLGGTLVVYARKR